MLNKVMLIGNVGDDPEVRYFDQTGGNPQGRKVARFSVATSERYRDANGNVQESTQWHTVVVWGAQADFVEKYVRKGSQLYVEGKLQNRSWTDQSGAKRYATEVNARTVQLLGRRDNAQASGQTNQQNQVPSTQNYGLQPPTAASIPPSAQASPAAQAVLPQGMMEASEPETDDLPF